jgi:hypothetical protein
MKKFSAAVVVALLLLAGRIGDLDSTPSQEGAVASSATPEAPSTSPSQILAGAVEGYLEGFSDREVVVRAAAARGRGREAPAGSGLDISTDDLTDVVGQYCVVCHNDVMRTGNQTLQDFAVERAAEWPEKAEKMIVKLRAGMMPPPGAPRPSPDTLLALVESLEGTMDAAASADPNPGSRRFQRLNRTEYSRMVHDLLALEVDAGRWLPADTYLGSFDNMSDAQGLSVTLMEGYMRAATEISRMAMGNPGALSASSKYTNPIEVSQHAWDHIEGTPFGTRGGIVVTHNFPSDGEYVFEVETLLGNGTGFEDVDFAIDGEGVALLALVHGGGSSVPIRTEPIFVRAGQHQISAAFVRKIDGPYDDRFSPFNWSMVGGEDSQSWATYGITALPHLSEFMITGPRVAAGVSETPSRAEIFICYPDSADAAEELACAESILSRLAGEAYRRPVTPEDLAGPIAFYESTAAEQGFEVGVRTGIQAILVSPSFIFRLEREPSGLQPGESYRLSDIELATRLSFFLWAAGPDEELLSIAAEGRLSEPGVLERQVDRMLEDERASTLATRFAAQWLRLQDAEKNQPEPFLYPDFNSQLSADMVRETELLFEHLVREDRSLFELYTADYTFINDRLARHYGIAGVSGSEFRRVQYPPDTRRGVLSHGSFLLLTSMSARTSPVLRGKWVMEVLMGTPPPPPPPDIPALEETEGFSDGRPLTTRQRMEKHRAAPTCNSCHRFMDPIGLALDSYDVTGRFRFRENGVPLDTRGTFYDGSDVSSPSELTEVLLKRPIPLVRTFTANLLSYSMGRRVEYYDQPAIRAINREAEANDYRMSSFILAVVRSDPFQMIRARVVTEADPQQER